ncbi:MAG: cache domain-containing protein, partial [Arcobacteraceae bacterium]
MFYKIERNLIFVIKYAPLVLILILSMFTTYFIEMSNRQQIADEIKFTTNFYLKLNNEQLIEDVNKLKEYIKSEDENSKEKLKSYIKERVYEAHSIATKIYDDNKDTKTKEEIFQLIKTALGSIIYNEGRGYFFIDDINGYNLLQPLNKRLENTDLSHTKDKNGYMFKQTIMQTIKDKTERFDTYYWPKNSQDKKQYEKISFYKYFAPLNVAIGTGEYIIDFDKKIKKNVMKYINDLNANDKSYIFVLDYSGTVLVHKNEALQGVNLFDEPYVSQYANANRFINLAKQGGGFLSYDNSTLKEKKTYKKTSYISSYEKWNWVLGTGYSDEDLTAIITNVKESLQKQNEKNFFNILVLSVVITIILLVVSLIISRYLETIFESYKERIKDEEKEFRDLFEYINIGLSVCDVDGKFVNVNSKFSLMLGYDDKKELLNKSWYDISKDEFIETENKSFNDLIAQRINTYTLEKSYIKEDGTHLDALITANLLKDKGKVKNILFSIIDITDIKAKDNLFFQQSKMASMGEMIANIAHQWRQPLSLISTASSGIKMQKEFDTLTDEQFDKSLDAITNATQYLSQTIEDFKNFFSPKENRETFTINNLVKKTLILVSAELEHKNISIITNIQDIEIQSFQNDFIQVLINIINNAKDALLKKEGERLIFIESYFESKNQLVLTITDNAGGINDEILAKIFEPYFTTKYKSNGTGIGLYMVMEIIQKHMHGTIKV